MADEIHQHGATGNSGHGGIYAILIVIVVLLVGGFIYFTGGFGAAQEGPEIEVEIPAPEVESPEMPSGGGEGGTEGS